MKSPTSDPGGRGEPAPGGDTLLARVAVPVPVDELFTYLVPEPLRDRVQPGARVRVPFGARRVVGFVVAVDAGGAAGTPAELRPLDDVIDPEPVLSDEIRQLCRWAASYYFASWGEMLACAIPGGSRAGPGRPRPRRLVAAISPAGEGPRWEAAIGRSVKRRELVARLRRAEGVLPAAELPRDARRLADPLLRDGLVAWEEDDPAPGPRATAAPVPLQWSPAQSEAIAALRTSLRDGGYQPFLLRGVTGSGKTEVYLAAADDVVAAGGGVLYLVPEIGLTPLLAQRFRARYGERVAVLHSGLASGRRHEDWGRVRRGEATVVLGARSAVFAPLPQLRLLVVDEEQEGSFKQEERPRYQARDLALVRGRRSGAVVVLGSATPSMESFHHARAGKYRLLELPTRVAERPLARADAIDMRAEFLRRGEQSILSSRLTELLKAGLERGEQSVLLLNRRGYAAFLLCRGCGAIPACPHCSVSLVLHRAEGRLRCHYCGFRQGSPDACPACGGGPLRQGSEGTERLEEVLAGLLPGARLARLDRDTVRRRGEAERILSAFGRGEHDILLGTQMVAKGHDFPRVTLVGVLGADAILGLPDFRAAERTFQLLTQVAGRSGRGEMPGRVVIQTFQPDHYAIRHACAQDFEAFFEEEIRFRRLLQYPPFTVLANLVVAHRDAAHAWKQAEVVAREIQAAGGEFLRVLGPAAAPISRLRERHRVQILVKARARGRLAEALRSGLAAAREQGHPGRHVMVDVDPMSLL